MRLRRGVSGWLIVGSAGLLLVNPESSEAKTKFKECDGDAVRNLAAARKFIIDNLSILQNDFELNERPKVEQRIRDRIRKKIGDVKFSCAEKTLCRDGQESRKGFHGSGILGNKIRICWNAVMADSNYKFCDLARTVTHEFGHAVGIPKERFGKHHGQGNDKVYQFGNFAYQLCRWKGLDRELTAASVSKPWATPKSGIAVYPRKNFSGWGLTLNGAQPDLRDIGRNNAISSVRVRSGRWQLCTKKNYGGTCKIW
nr:beta/gamma crystallin-related protein [Polyangiaceae bacterium]